jgi:hypothetical protein
MQLEIIKIPFNSSFLFPKDFLCYIALGGGLGDASRYSRYH